MVLPGYSGTLTVYREHLTVGGLVGASALANQGISPPSASDITGKDHAAWRREESQLMKTSFGCRLVAGDRVFTARQTLHGPVMGIGLYF